MNQRNSSTEPATDWPVFGWALGLLLSVCALLFLFPVASKQFIDQSYAWITNYFGVFYLWAGILVLAFCIWIACSRHGSIKLGDPDSQPQFSLYSWASMLFCAGVATGFLGVVGMLIGRSVVNDRWTDGH